MLWEFMKKTEFFTTFYNEIELFYFKAYYLEPLHFSTMRNMEVSDSFKTELLKVIAKNCPNLKENPYIDDVLLKNKGNKE